MSAGGHGDQPTTPLRGPRAGVPVAEPAGDEGDEEAGDSTDDSVDDHAGDGLIEGEDRATVESDQPNQRIIVPKIAIGIFDGLISTGVPSGRNRPRRGPTTMMAASAAQPPIE